MLEKALAEHLWKGTVQAGPLVSQVVNSVVKPERLSRFDIIKAGDDVDKKKPDPMIYNMARELLGLPAAQCVVIEDSLVGLRAAKGAGMRCVITYTESTKDQDFFAEGADAVVEDLAGVTIDSLFAAVFSGEKRRSLKA